MFIDRRGFLHFAARASMTAASAPLWSNVFSQRAMAQSASSYKAIIVITLPGGNDGNNTLIPLDNARYQQYAALRPSIALPQNACIPLTSTSTSEQYGLHPSLPNLAALYNSKKALIVANAGPRNQPGSKNQLLTTETHAVPEGMFSHPAGLAEHESGSIRALPTTGWGGRIADQVIQQSGSLPPLMDLGISSIFTVGNAVQGISVKPGGKAFSLPPGVSDAVRALADLDSRSPNHIIAQAGALRYSAAEQQLLLDQAQASGTPLKTVFPGSYFGQQMQTIAKLINGRSVIGANRQIFYAQQGQYDTHGGQLKLQAGLLSELDGGLGALLAALEEMGLTGQVLIQTLSDFGRTMVDNVLQGTDHAWGNHQFVLGGGIKGGRILGTYPDLDLGGSMDWNGSGVWIPSVSVTELTAGVGAWMGLSPSQLQDVFPDLINFPNGALSFS